jgi:hypothetical protein
VLDLDQRPERDVAGGSGRGRLAVEGQAATSRQPSEAAIGTVGDDRPQPRQRRQLVGEEQPGRDDVAGPGEIDPAGERQPQDVDQDRALGAERPAAPAARVMECRAGPAALGGLVRRPSASRARGDAPCPGGSSGPSRLIACAHTPFARQRRHLLQTAVIGREALLVAQRAGQPQPSLN